MDSYLSIAIRQDQQDYEDKENLAQSWKLKGKGLALEKVDNQFYRPSSYRSDPPSSISLSAEEPLAAGEKNPVNPVNPV